MSTDIGVARKQSVFAVKETTVGTLVFPSDDDLIIPAGNAVMNQSPDFVDSEEIRDSLDVLDQFQAAMPPGTFTVPMYLRPHATEGSDPQGDVLFESLQGEKTTGDEATMATDVATADDILYKQATTAPSFSLWIKTDHFVQGMSGCTTGQAVVSVTNEGAVKGTFTGQGMQMVWAGTDALQASAATGATHLTVEDADRFKAGARIYNETQDDTNGGVGYEIDSVTSATNLLVLTEGIDASWATDDVIKGYLPDGTEIGSPIEGRHTAITINEVSATIKASDLTINSPKQYVTDEVGTTYPEAYMEDVRAITSTLSLYFRKEDAKYFAEGYEGNEVPIRITFGAAGSRQVILHMEKCKLQVPEMDFAAPAVNINMEMTALGTSGEDSLEIIFS